MRGFTLLEFVVATSLFLLILLVGYEAVRAQKDLISLAQSRTVPEAESNYRLLVLKHLLESSSDALRADPMLETVPSFFPDLSFGQTLREDAFSIATVVGSAARFQREANLYRVSSVASLQMGDMLLLGGENTREQFGWNYARIANISNNTLELRFLAGETLERGACVEVQMNGFLFKKGTLYWISPSGQAAPFLGPLDDFHYSWNAPQITISWQTGQVNMEFTSTL